MKRLHFGDNLEFLKRLNADHPEGLIDLIYIDPPFNSKRDYNVLFESVDMKDSTAQKQAFADTWSNVSYIDSLNELQELNLDLYSFLKNLDGLRISKNTVAYLTTMAIRIYYMHKVLKETGSFYLHCDPTMSHYLKVVCDLVFGYDKFRNEVVWKRTSAHNDPNKYGANIDILLYYTKGDHRVWNEIFTKHDIKYIERFSRKDTDGRLWSDYDLTAKGLSGGGYEYEYKGAKSLWRVPPETMKRLDEEGKLYFTNKGGIRLKRYLDETKGVALQCLWDDISPINSQAQERLGYPTQKPETLLERIINASSNEGDLVADFFCGCGTAIAVANKLKRNWIGVDISHLAIRLVKDRLLKPLKSNISEQKKLFQSIQFTGFPKDIDSAKELARNTTDGRFGFQDWIIEVMLGGVSNQVKVGDGGFDGYATFYRTETEKETVIIEVKSGNVTVKNVREFIHVVEIQHAAIGVFVCFDEQLTKPMQHEAKVQGYYNDEYWKNTYPKIQILTVEQILEGEGIKMPESTKTTFKTAKSKSQKHSNQQVLL